MDNNQFLLILSVVVVSNVIIFIFLGKKNNNKDGSEVEKLKEVIRLNSEELRRVLGERLDSGRESVDENFRQNRKESSDEFSKSRKEMSDSFRESRSEQVLRHQEERKIIENNFQKITQDMETRGLEIDKKMERIMKDVESFSSLGKNIGLLLSTSQARGSLGERHLEKILRDHIGKPGFHWERQYQFRSLENDKLQADVIIKCGEYKLVIDSKFPMDNFLRYKESMNDKSAKKSFEKDLKKHIDSVSKYVLPEEMVYGNAIMFLPTMGLLDAAYDISSIENYANEKKVSLAGPENILLFIAVIQDNIKMNTFKNDLIGIMQKVKGLSKRAQNIKDKARKAQNNNRIHMDGLKELESQAKGFTKDVENLNNEYQNFDSDEMKKLPEAGE